jgi:hypothetical protein
MSFFAKSLTEWKIARVMTWRWILENQISTWLTHERIGRRKMDPEVAIDD